MTVVGVILAGGRSERMEGADKSLAQLDGRPLIAHVAERLAPQVHRLIISANGDPTRFAHLNFPVVADADASQSGPLAGILAALKWAETNVPEASWLVSVPTDTPFLPTDLVARLLAAAEDTGTVRVASSGGRVQQVVALWPLALATDLSHWLAAGRSRAVRAWLDTRHVSVVPFPMAMGIDPFLNINTPQDLERAELPYLEASR